MPNALFLLEFEQARLKPGSLLESLDLLLPRPAVQLFSWRIGDDAIESGAPIAERHLPHSISHHDQKVREIQIFVYV